MSLRALSLTAIATMAVVSAVNFTAMGAEARLLKLSDEIVEGKIVPAYKKIVGTRPASDAVPVRYNRIVVDGYFGPRIKGGLEGTDRLGYVEWMIYTQRSQIVSYWPGRLTPTAIKSYLPMQGSLIEPKALNAISNFINGGSVQADDFGDASGNELLAAILALHYDKAVRRDFSLLTQFEPLRPIRALREKGFTQLDGAAYGEAVQILHDVVKKDRSGEYMQVARYQMGLLFMDMMVQSKLETEQRKNLLDLTKILFQSITKDDPKSSLAWQWLGYIDMLGAVEDLDFSKAVKNFKKAVEAEPDNPEPYWFLMNLYRISGRLKTAISYGRKYLELNVNRGGTRQKMLQIMGQMYFQLGEYVNSFYYVNESLKFEQNLYNYSVLSDIMTTIWQDKYVSERLAIVPKYSLGIALRETRDGIMAKPAKKQAQEIDANDRNYILTQAFRQTSNMLKLLEFNDRDVAKYAGKEQFLPGDVVRQYKRYYDRVVELGLRIYHENKKTGLVKSPLEDKSVRYLRRTRNHWNEWHGYKHMPFLDRTLSNRFVETVDEYNASFHKIHLTVEPYAVPSDIGIGKVYEWYDEFEVRRRETPKAKKPEPIPPIDTSSYIMCLRCNSRHPQLPPYPALDVNEMKAVIAEGDYPTMSQVMDTVSQKHYFQELEKLMKAYEKRMLKKLQPDATRILTTAGIPVGDSVETIVLQHVSGRSLHGVLSLKAYDQLVKDKPFDIRMHVPGKDPFTLRATINKAEERKDGYVNVVFDFYGVTDKQNKMLTLFIVNFRSS